jgi:hypothetical protein
MGAFQASRLDSPPPSPPDVTGQTGASPLSGMTSMLGDKLKGGGEQGSISGAHPQGAVLAMVEAMKKAGAQLSKIEPGMAPFVDRALSILEQGAGEVVSKGKPVAGAGEEPSPMEPPPGGSKAPDSGGGAGFPG